MYFGRMKCNLIFLPLDLDDCTVSGHKDIYRGQNISLTCLGNGYPYPQFTWFFQGQKLNTHSRIRIKGNKLDIFNATKNYVGEYRCVALNQYSNVSCGSHMSVKGLYGTRFSWIFHCDNVLYNLVNVLLKCLMYNLRDDLVY